MGCWVRVKDKLPKEGQEVIFVTNNYSQMYIGYYSTSLGWTNYEYVDIQGVVCWMTKPEIPEELINEKA